MNYFMMTVKKLNSLCKKRGIKGYSNKTKSEVIKLITLFENKQPVSSNECEIATNRFETINRLMNILIVSKINHEERIMNLPSLKQAHIYCLIHNIPSQQYGTLLEKYIRTKYNYIKNKAQECRGDCFKNNKNAEIKVSLGGLNRNKFNFVQIRLYHNCEIYILTAFNLSFKNVESEGELYIFKIPKQDIKKLIIRFGNYAHGTFKKNGIITNKSINNKNNIKEYAIRTIINDACWKYLLYYKIEESEL